MTTTRTPGKCGLRPADPFRPAPRFGVWWNRSVPAHPKTEDYLASLADWAMLGNDQAGDCVAVTWANLRRLITHFVGAKEIYPTQDQVWAIYRTQNPDFDPNGDADSTGPGSPADRGMDIQTLLDYLVEHGGPDGVKAVAYAQVDALNESELDAALAIFGGVWTGVVVQAAQQQQFAQGAEWDYDPDSPEEGGHSVLAGGYAPDPRFITWAAETGFTDSFRTHLVSQTWVVVWPEHLGSKAFLQGVDVKALEADFTAVTGRRVEWPVTA
jgi:hypothetical protein